MWSGLQHGAGGLAMKGEMMVVAVRLPAGLWRDVKREADRRLVSASDVVRAAILSELGRSA